VKLRIRTIDAHAAGEPLRLIVDGFPAPRGRTMLEKREWVRRHADELRRALMLEPRGHADMYGAVLTEPVSPGSHAGVLFMHNEGYSTMCGHGIVAVTTIALERGLIVPGRLRAEGASASLAGARANDGRAEAGDAVIYDTPAGVVRARVASNRSARPSGRASDGLKPVAYEEHSGATPEREARSRVESVAFVNVPSFVLHAGLTLRIGARQVRADVAFGGAFYAIVDSEAVGLPIDRAHLPELRRIGMEIKRAVEAQQTVAHPSEPGLRDIYGTIFTGPPSDERADLRNVTIFADAEVDRSPCGTGTCAVMAVLDDMGLLGADKPFVHESLIGTRFRGRVASRTTVGEFHAIVPEIEGSAWITGEHTFVIDEDDPLKDGFRL
jgi:proline racemase